MEKMDLYALNLVTYVLQENVVDEKQIEAYIVKKVKYKQYDRYMFATAPDNGYYYVVVYNRKKKEWQLDIYVRHSHRVIPASD